MDFGSRSSTKKKIVSGGTTVRIKVSKNKGGCNAEANEQGSYEGKY